MLPLPSSARPFVRARLFVVFLCVLAGLLGLLPVAPAAAQDTVPVTVESAILRALDESPEVGQRDVRRRFAERRSRYANAARFLTEFTLTTAHAAAPGLDLPDGIDLDTYDPDALYLLPDLENDWTDLRPFNRFEVEVLQPIYTGGEINAQIEAARHAVGVERARVSEKEAEVAFRTGELYYSLLLAGALTSLTEQGGDIVRQAKETVQDLLDAGDPDVDDADLYQVLITEQEYLRRVAEVNQGLLRARAALSRQLFLPEGTIAVPDTALLVPIPFTLDSVDTYFQIALAQRPELRQAAAGLRAQNALVDAARSDYYPKVFFSVRGRLTLTQGRYRQPNPYVSDPFRGRSLAAGVGIRQQLNFFQTRANVEEARVERDAVAFQQQGARQLILFEVEDAYRNVLVAQAALASRDEALTLSREWLRTEQINFDLDLGSTENLIDAVQANLELQAAYYEAVRTYNVAVLRLLRASGLLVDRVRAGTLLD